MSRRKIDSFSKSTTHFIAEQFGAPENEFKESIICLLQSQSRPLRTYLAQVEYGEEKDSKVALCVASNGGEDEGLAYDIASIFRHMFGSHEHLDIVFLTEIQEVMLRKVCCPFFSSKRISSPDFFLTSSEGYGLEEVRACYKLKRLVNSHSDGYILCDIEPPIVGQSYGLGGQDINQVIVAHRHAEYTLFAINKWPAYVHVARLTCNIPNDKFTIAESDIETIGWAEIYDSLTAAKTSLM
jgi:hypothetical protein